MSNDPNAYLVDLLKSLASVNGMTYDQVVEQIEQTVMQELRNRFADRPVTKEGVMKVLADLATLPEYDQIITTGTSLDEHLMEATLPPGMYDRVVYELRLRGLTVPREKPD